MLPQTTLIALKPWAWLRNSKTQFRPSLLDVFVCVLLLCYFASPCSSGDQKLLLLNDWKICGDFLTFFFFFSPQETRAQFCSPNWPGCPKLSYSSYSPCKGSAVIRFIHSEAQWAETRISREQGRLNVPLLLSPQLYQAYSFLCLLFG